MCKTNTKHSVVKRVVSGDENNKLLGETVAVDAWKKKKASVKTDITIKGTEDGGQISIGLENTEVDAVSDRDVGEHLNDLMGASLYQAIGMTDPSMCTDILAQTEAAMPGKSVGVAKKANAALNFFKEMQPKDAYESMLISRMISLHAHYMHYLARATNPDIGTEAESMNISRASKLIRLWNESKASLDKHRKKEDQKVVVEHIHVNAGGKAIVGSSFTTSSNTDGGVQ